MTQDTRFSSRTHRARAWGMLGLCLVATLAIGAAHRVRTAAAPPTPTSAGTIAAEDGVLAVSGTLDRSAVLLGSDGLVRMELVLAARAAAAHGVSELPTDLVVVLDHSGSMQGQKIADARAAIRHLIDQLRPEDRFALVTFSTTAATRIPLGHATPSARADWGRSVAAVEAGGGTFMGPGLDRGLGILEAARAPGRSLRAIVLSDGLASEPDAVLTAQATRATAGEFALSAVGIGADFNELLMAALADAGSGNYYYLQDTGDLAGVFASEFATARETVASALAVTLLPGPGVEVLDAAGYPLARQGAAVTFRPGTLFAGQERRVWVTLRVPSDRVAEHPIGAVQVSYRGVEESHRVVLPDLPQIACVADEDGFFAALDADAWSQAVVVDEYNQLRQEVAGLVRSGEKAAALRAIGDFRTRNARLNETVASPSVARRIDVAGELEDDVAAAFVGADAPAKQKLLGKSLHAEGQLERRVGDRK